MRKFVKVRLWLVFTAWLLAANGTNLFAGCDNGFVYRFGQTGWKDTGLQTVALGYDVDAVIWTSNGLYAIANSVVYNLAGIGDRLYAGSGLGVFRNEDPVIANTLAFSIFDRAPTAQTGHGS